MNKEKRKIIEKLHLFVWYLLISSILLFSFPIFVEGIQKLFANLGMRYLVYGLNEGISENEKRINIEKAIEWIDYAARLGSGYVYLDKYYSIVYLKTGDYDDVINRLQNYINKYPSDTLSKMVLADAYLYSNMEDEAFRIYENIQDDSVILQKANEYIEKGNIDIGERFLDIVLGDDNNYLITDQKYFSYHYYHLAKNYALILKLAMGKGESERINRVCTKGMESFDAGIHNDPQNVSFIIDYGKFLRSCKKYDTAIEKLSIINDNYSLSAQGWASLEIGLTYSSIGDIDMAVKFYNRAVILDPKNGRYRIMLGNAYGMMGETDKALEQFEIALSDADPTVQEWARSEIDQLK